MAPTKTLATLRLDFLVPAIATVHGHPSPLKTPDRVSMDKAYNMVAKLADRVGEDEHLMPALSVPASKSISRAVMAPRDASTIRKHRKRLRLHDAPRRDTRREAKACLARIQRTEVLGGAGESETWVMRNRVVRASPLYREVEMEEDEEELGGAVWEGWGDEEDPDDWFA